MARDENSQTWEKFKVLKIISKKWYKYELKNYINIHIIHVRFMYILKISAIKGINTSVTNIPKISQ